MSELDEGFAFHKISFQWYPAIGAVMTWITAIFVSYLTGGPDMSKFDIKLFSPFIQKMLPNKYHLTELKIMDQKISTDKANTEIGAKHELTGLIATNN